jgi:hypothetical protein
MSDSKPETNQVVSSRPAKIKVKMPKKDIHEKNEIVKPTVAAIEASVAAGIPTANPSVEPETSKDSKEETSVCSICIDTFTSKVRRCLTCPYCHEKICGQCLEKYLLNTIDDPHCVNCRRGWNQSLLQTFCTKTFLTKTYADYRSNILLNRNKSYLPRYQEQAERVRAAQKFRLLNTEHQEELKKLNEEFVALQQQYEQKRHLILRNISKNGLIASDIESGRRDLEGNLLQQNGHVHVQETHERKKFVRRCPAEGCNGFLSQVWKCGLCAKWTCPDCFTVKGLNQHVCKDEDKATADEIRKRTKPCPNCGELIEKSEGCDQMFCISCHSPFSWIRGEVIKTGVIHNPHYFEWLQRNGGALDGRHYLDIPCGGLPAYGSIFHKIRDRIYCNKPKEESEFKKLINQLGNAYRTCAHIIDVERNRWIAHTRPDDNTDLGVAFLLGNITEDEWRNRLKHNERSRIKSKEVRDILDAFNNAAIDIWRQIDGELKENMLKYKTANKKLQEWLDLLCQLKNFINPALLEISRIYNFQVPQIQDDMTFYVTSLAKIRKQTRMEEAILAEAEKGLHAAVKEMANAGAQSESESTSKSDSDSDSDSDSYSD